MKVAIAHDYLFQFGGAEKLVEAWLEIFPEADLYTTFVIPEKFSKSKLITKTIKEKRIRTTFLQFIFTKLGLLRFFKHLFWVYPIAASTKVIKNYDLVIVSSSYCGKNFRIIGTKKIYHYIHTPTRFLYRDETEIDHKSLPKIFQLFIPFFKFWLRILDQRAMKKFQKQGAVTTGNSKFIKNEIKKAYNIEAKYIYPPVEIENFLNNPRSLQTKKPFYLYFGRISFHKKIDLAIMACLQLKRNLKIVGATAYKPEEEKLKSIIYNFKQKNPESKVNIEFLGRVPDDQRNQLISKAKAIIFPPKEDFGIAPVESLAAGCPVIAYNSGGAQEYILDGQNGVFFEEQSVDSLIGGIKKFEKVKYWDVEAIRKSSKSFSKQAFFNKFKKLMSYK